MSHELEELLGAERDEVLDTIRKHTIDSPLSEIREGIKAARLLRRHAEDAQTRAEEASLWIWSALYLLPEWVAWSAIRWTLVRASRDYKRSQAKRSAKWYANGGGDARKTPEARARLAAQRKAQRARARAEQETSQ